MRRIEELMDAVRANPVRFTGWMILLVLLAAAGLTVGDAFGIQLYLFTNM